MYHSLHRHGFYYYRHQDEYYNHYIENYFEQCYKKLVKKEFDIILLDYLLKDDYGYSLLKAVEGKNSRIIKGPHDELFFMFISAFTTAVSERLTFEGYSRNMNWHIGEGACPTNTPELFKYRLLQ